MSCVLSIMGENLDVDTFVRETGIIGFEKSYKGDPLGASIHRKIKSSRAFMTISLADFDDMNGQIKDTIHFLNEHKEKLKVIASTPGVEYATIDFGINSTIDEEHLTQTFSLPKNLIKVCADLDIEIELSIYKEDVQVILERKYQENKLRSF